MHGLMIVGQDVGQKAKRAIEVLGSPKNIWDTLWNRSIYPNPSASQWGRSLWQHGVRPAASLVRQKIAGLLNTTYSDVVNSVANGSRLSAKESPVADIWSQSAFFGSLHPGEHSLITPIVSDPTARYLQFFNMLDAFAKQGSLQKLNMDESTYQILLDTKSFAPISPNVWRNQNIGVLPDGTEIPLTMVMTWSKPASVFNSPYGPTSGNVNAFGYHFRGDFSMSAATRLTKVRTHLQNVFQKVVNPASTREQVVDAVAEIHWWEANLCAYARGSNGIADGCGA